MDSTSKLLIILVGIASADYFALRIMNLISWKLKVNKTISTREEKYKDKDFWEE